MPIELSHSQVVVLIRQTAFERAGITRKAIDERYRLTDEEFRVDSGLVVLGPLPSEDLLPDVNEEGENGGLVYVEDFYELSGNWPDWLTLFVRGAIGRGT